MPVIKYREKRISADRLVVIEKANEILEEYARQGFDLTLRQLYYQFVARDLIPNNIRSYKRLGDIIDDGRMCGLIDWDRIEDRTRNLQRLSAWTSIPGMIDSAFQSYRRDRWRTQPCRVELWCFPPETPVVTASGVTPIGDVQVGEKVMTHTGEFERVTESITHEHDGEIVEVKATGMLPIRCTPNHKFWVYPCDTSKSGYKGKDRKYGEPCWKAAADLNPFDMLVFPRTSVVRDRTQVFMFGGSRSTNPGFVQLDHNLLRLIGHYLAEGNVMFDGRTVQFTFGGTEHEHAAFVERCARSVGFNYHTYFFVKASTIVVYVFGKALAKWLGGEFGSGAYSKKLPEWFMSLPHEKQMTTIKYHFFGDGTLRDNTRSALLVSTRSECLARQEQIVLLRCGYLACLNMVSDHGSPMFRVSVSGASGQQLADGWGVKLASRKRRYNHARLSAQAAMFPMRSVETQSFKGTVYNLEVEHDHSYCVPVAVHNCEKEALIGIFARVCEEWDVPYFACRGYVSQSEMWRAAQRLLGYKNAGQRPVIIHFGDHDPSGIDMSRDIGARLTTFRLPITVERLALNMDQVEAHRPPPNPAKTTDARFESYVVKYGSESWELDALSPTVLTGLVETAIHQYRDADKWNATVKQEIEERATLKVLKSQWAGIDKFLDESHSERIVEAEEQLTQLADYQNELSTPSTALSEMQTSENEVKEEECERCGNMVSEDELDDNDLGVGERVCNSCAKDIRDEDSGNSA